MTSLFARHKKKLVALAVVLATPLVMHVWIEHTVRFDPLPVTTPKPEMKEVDGVRRAGRGWSVVRGVRITELAGTPEEIGAEHTALLYDKMAVDESVLWDGFASLVPFSPARTFMFDLGRLRYRHVEDGFPEARRRELSAEARGFTPDPYAHYMPTYPRMVFLHALYDIALGFEHSPLLGNATRPHVDGCTAFGLGPDATEDGHALFARTFDFEAADVFDRDKVVFVVRENGLIPFASVAWPGFVGVVTGMNAEGVAIAVHGGRAREPVESGLPVAFSLREVLSNAHDTDEAVAILARQPVMVSHILFVGDAKGHYAVVERAPGVDAFVRKTFADPSRVAITNHFEGPLAQDPKDARVRASTTTLQRRARIDELLRELPPRGGSVTRAVSMLRDHGCAGASCPMGDRRAIDAFISTHGIVADMTAKVLWVSEGPHLSGRFVKIDVGSIVSREDSPVPPPELEEIPEDPALHDGRYEAGRARAGGPLLGPGR
jgi:isopenicillin-N N-acyltransferase-like protein